MRFAFFFLAEYTNLFLAAAFATTLFLGRMARVRSCRPWSGSS